jgi:hypothetical protein
MVDAGERVGNTRCRALRFMRLNNAFTVLSWHALSRARSRAVAGAVLRGYADNALVAASRALSAWRERAFGAEWGWACRAVDATRGRKRHGGMRRAWGGWREWMARARRAKRGLARRELRVRGGFLRR